MKLLVINGPNLNMLGIREPHIYGSMTYADLCTYIELIAKEKSIDVTLFQSNHEGAIVDVIQQAYQVMDGIIINPGAYTHTSIAILDALKSVSIAAIEVHLSNPYEREEFRHISYVSLACFESIYGKGKDGYRLAIDSMINHLKQK